MKHKSEESGGDLFSPSKISKEGFIFLNPKDESDLKDSQNCWGKKDSFRENLSYLSQG